MIKVQMKVTPIKQGNYYEPCMISFRGGNSQNWYASSIVHIDSFFTEDKYSNDSYAELREGKEVIYELTPINSNFHENTEE